MSTNTFTRIFWEVADSALTDAPIDKELEEGNMNHIAQA